MINKIKFSDQFNSNCLKLNNVLLGVNYGISYGPTNITNFWAGVTPPENGYTIYIDRGDSIPTIFCELTGEDLIRLVKKLGYTEQIENPSQAISWLNSNGNSICVNMDYPDIVTDGLISLVDSGFLPSYSRTGESMNDLSGASNSVVVNSLSFSESNFGYFNMGTTSSLLINGDVSNQFCINGEGTISIWCSLDFNTNTVGIFDDYVQGVTGAYLFIRNFYDDRKSDQFVEFALMSSGEKIFSFPYILVNDHWNNFVISYKNTTIGFYPRQTIITIVEVYVNGLLMRQYSSNLGNWSPTSQHFGFMDRLGNSPSPGKYSNIQIYNKALNEREVVQNYDALKDRYNKVVLDNLVDHLDAGMTSSYTGGSVWNDVVSGLEFSLGTGTSYNEKYGSITFDGTSNGYAQSLDTLGTLSQFTLEVWTNVYDSYGDAPCLFHEIIANGKSNFAIVVMPSKIAGGGFLNESWDWIIENGTSINFSEWLQLTITFDGNSIKIYKNGVFMVSQPKSLSPISSNSGYLISNGFGEQTVTSEVSIVRIYNRALSNGEILQNFDSGKSRHGL